MNGVNVVALVVFVFFFAHVTVMGFLAATWKLLVAVFVAIGAAIKKMFSKSDA